MQYCEWTHVIGEIITCRIVGSFMKGSDGHEHKAQREKKHGRDSSQCWRQWGWCCTCDTTHSHSPIQSLHSLTCTHSYVLLTQKYYAIQYILVFLFNFYLPFVLYLVFFQYYNIVPYPIAIRILRISWKRCIVRVCKVNINTNTFFYHIGKQSTTEWFTRIISRVWYLIEQNKSESTCRSVQNLPILIILKPYSLYLGQIYYCTLSLLLHD